MSDWQLSSQAIPRRACTSPIDVWIRAVVLCIALLYLLCGYFIYFGIPLPTASDRQHFDKQIQLFAESVDASRQNGNDPLITVFIGTSRIKNVALDPARVSQVAQTVGIERPVISSLLAVNWGGFQRLSEAVDEVARMRPDYVVVMPEVLHEDFALPGRAMIAFRYVQHKLRRRDHTLFDSEDEFEKAACSGFDDAADDRVDLDATWIRSNPKDPGPQAAANALKELAANGAQIHIVDIPAHPELTKAKARKFDTRTLLTLHGLDRIQNIHVPSAGIAVPVSAYCDYAHIDPEKADVWLAPLFKRIADDLN